MIYPRIIKPFIQDAFNYFPVILLTGARQVGKSTLALALRDNYLTLDDITVYSSAKEDPVSFISSLKKPVVIDEVQKLPELLPAIKQKVDQNRQNGDFLLTGSANVLALKNITDTLAGRMAIFELLPLSRKEVMKSDENVVDLIFGGNLSEKNLANIEEDEIIQQVINGGYPEITKIDSQRSRYIWFSSYISTYIERDIRDIGELRHLDKFIRVYNILASRSAQILHRSDLAKDADLDHKTVNNYLKLLELIYQIRLLRPYSANINKRFIKSEKVFFTDSGIVSFLLGIATREHFFQSPYKGIIFETFVLAELLKGIQYSLTPTRIFYYRTQDRSEIDFIIERERGIIAIEVKCTKSVVKRDFKHIIDLKKSTGNLTCGIILYLGETILPFGEDLLAVPIRLFW